MRQAPPPLQPREFVGDACRVVVERMPSVPRVLVSVALGNVLDDAVMLSFTPAQFDQLAHDLAAVNQRVQEAAREFLRESGVALAGGSA